MTRTPDQKIIDVGGQPFTPYVPGRTIRKRAGVQANQIYHGYTKKGIGELHVVTVAIGGIFWSTYLTEKIAGHHPDFRMTHDLVQFSSYGQGRTASGVVREIKPLTEPVEGRHVLVIDDIVEKGGTLAFLLNKLETLSPASVAVAALVDKVDVHNGRVQVDYPGIIVHDNPWLAGCGMDNREYGRALPYMLRSAGPNDPQEAPEFEIPEAPDHYQL